MLATVTAYRRTVISPMEWALCQTKSCSPATGRPERRGR